MTTWRSLFCATTYIVFVRVGLLAPSVPQIQGPAGQGSSLRFLQGGSPKINE